MTSRCCGILWVYFHGRLVASEKRGKPLPALQVFVYPSRGKKTSTLTMVRVTDDLMRCWKRFERTSWPSSVLMAPPRSMESDNNCLQISRI
ncbi:TPA: hypothetical protein N0F65_005645 [Lagenidium giganteum]|uniref:Secreted protein n=1 Tax=Lagenidium giganteum TaxID=4803 RepID=A0AAV2YXZ8_9STRA|nr:TPA: hypothetical protein N0F65_005645 [Lagenidium giganteum]